MAKEKKKAAHAADAVQTTAKAAGVERKKAEDRLDAELRAASAAPEVQRKSIFCGKSRSRRPMKVNQKAVERHDGFVLNDDQFCVKLKIAKDSRDKPD